MTTMRNEAPHTRRVGDPPVADQLTQPERMSVDELRATQLQRLQGTLRHAYEHVPFYRAKFDAAEVHPDDCREPADLAKFPCTTKQELRDNYPFGMLAVPETQLSRIHASSGTTGKPTVAGYTAADIDNWAAAMARSIFAAGGRPGHKVHVSYGYGLFTGGLGAHYGVEKLGATAIPASGGMTARQVQLINDFRPEVIMVTPSYMLALLDEFERQGIAPARCSLRYGIFGAEPWTERMRAEIEERMNLHATDIYGLTELMGPGVAQECVETKDGLHVWEDHFYPEVVDPVELEVLPDGAPGELVFTSLTKQAMPVIRYRTKDLSVLRPGTSRPAFRRMEKVTGRSDDMIILRGVNVFPTQIEEIVLCAEGCAPHFQIALSTEGRMDRMRVLVEAAPDADAERRRSAAERITAGIKDGVGVSANVDIVDPDTLERSVGKLRRVIDQRRRR